MRILCGEIRILYYLCIQKETRKAFYMEGVTAVYIIT